MKKIISIILLSLLFTLPVPAVKVKAEPTSHPEHYVTDGAGLLSESEYATLDAYLSRISHELNFDIVVVTTHTLDGKSPRDYTEDFYVDNNYGLDADRSGVIFLRYITEDGSDYEVYIASTGKGQKLYDTDYDFDMLIDKVADYIIEGRYAKAFTRFADIVSEDVRDYDRQVAEYNENVAKHGGKYVPPYNPVWILIGLGVGLAVGGIAIGSMKRQLISVSTAGNATGYIKQGSFKLKEKTDTFLYKNVSAVPIPRNTSSGGHSTSHTHSSGHSFSGGGRHI